jgi:RNAse (barnase) inhibitor barstar
VDWDSFHQAFQEAMGFPVSYAKDMDAWIDCMSYLCDAEAGLTGGVLVIEIAKAVGFKSRCPEQFAELVECTALVNHRFVEEGQSPPLALLFL